MKRVFLFLILMVLVLPSTVTVAQQPARFLSVISEMPLMPGLIEEPDSAVVFEGPSGRIIEVVAIGDVSVNAIRSFYASILPELGWVLLENGDYHQEDEILRLEFIHDPAERAKSGIRFLLYPLGSS